nr:DEAD/DEAH box helicase [Lachnospiraceae bacterium]
CEDGGYYAVRGTISRVNNKYNGRYYTVVRLECGDGFLTCMFFSRADYYAELIGNHIGEEAVFCGKIRSEYKFDRMLYSMSPPEHFFFNDSFRPWIDRIYPNIKGVSDEMRDNLIKETLEKVEEPLSWEVMSKFGLIDYKSALENLHYPKDTDMIEKGRERVLFNDLLYFAILFRLGETSDDLKSGVLLKKVDMCQGFIKSLPFSLTEGQKGVLNRMIMNSRSGMRNNILLQGDVGCGKTIVAVIMMIAAYENGYQSVLMAPKEILARQHYEEISGYAGKLGINAAFLHSGMKAAERKKIFEGIRSGEISFVIGTHSCLSDKIEYKSLGLIIIDEEHLFGVEQKEILEKKAVDGVHMLSMSATPVPRSLATVMYGNKKEIMTIKTKPQGRLPVQTATQVTHKNTFPFVEKEIRAGHQCYVVCPSIDDREDTGIVSIESVLQEYKEYFEPRGIRIGTVHGKMNKDDIASVIKEFTENRVQILISTTVIEVGVNVPNATVIVIEQADRFGLASLHQLRGRVGRSSLQSYCILRSEDTENERLEVMVRTQDGFEIAEADLKQRGTGNLIGEAQSGMNKYVEEMLDNPELFKRAGEAASYCYRHGYADRLIKMYKEHEREE